MFKSIFDSTYSLVMFMLFAWFIAWAISAGALAIVVQLVKAFQH